MLLSKGMIQADIMAARQAIDYFEEKHFKDMKNIAAYHLQQAVEKLIKIQIYAHGSNISNRQMYTHNILKLIAYADAICSDADIPEYIREHSLQITDWEAGSRYDVGFSVRIDVLKKMLAVVSEWAKSCSD